MGTRRGRAMATGTENEGDCFGGKACYIVSTRARISAFREMPPLGKEG